MNQFEGDTKILKIEYISPSRNVEVIENLKENDTQIVGELLDKVKFGIKH